MTLAITNIFTVDTDLFTLATLKVITLWGASSNCLWLWNTSDDLHTEAATVDYEQVMRVASFLFEN